MTERHKAQGPFDERAALGELERFRADIERYRRQREDVSDDFEEFVRSFPSPVDVFPSEQAASRQSSSPAAQPAPPAQRDAQSASAAPAVSERPIATTPVPRPIGAPRTTPRPSAIDAARPAATAPVEVARPAAAPARHGTQAERPKRARTPLLATLLLLLIALAVGVWMFRGGQQPRQSTSPSSAGQTAQPGTPVDTAPPQAPPPAVAPAPVESEITTVRRAWVRLTADGERVLERELPPDTRVPFNAEKTIVIRTGDAGAVRLTIRGEDHGVLGRDGEVVTRSFTVPANQSR